MTCADRPQYATHRAKLHATTTCFASSPATKPAAHGVRGNRTPACETHKNNPKCTDLKDTLWGCSAAAQYEPPPTRQAPAEAHEHENGHVNHTRRTVQRHSHWGSTQLGNDAGASGCARRAPAANVRKPSTRSAPQQTASPGHRPCRD